MVSKTSDRVSWLVEALENQVAKPETVCAGEASCVAQSDRLSSLV